MKFVKLSLATVAVLGIAGSAMAADTLADAFKNGKVSGQARLYYQSVADGLDAPVGPFSGVLATNQSDGLFSNEGASANVGVKLAYETAPFKNFSIGGAFYATDTLNLEEGKMGLVTDTVEGGTISGNDGDIKTATVLGEAYLKYASGNTAVIAGRQKVDTPIVNSFDDRMVPYLYEGIVVANSDIKDLTLVGAYLSGTRVSLPGAYYDVMYGTFDDFVDMNGDNGAYALGAIYSGIKDLKAQLFYYMLPDLANIAYAQLDYSAKIDSTVLSLAGQYYNANLDIPNANLDDINSYGVKLGADFEGGFGLMAAYTSTDDPNHKIGVLTYGTDPLFTSSIVARNGGFADTHWNVQTGLPQVGAPVMTSVFGATAADTDSYKVGANYTGFKDLTLQASYASYDHGNNSDPFVAGKTIAEVDVAAVYQATKELNVLLGYVNIDTDDLLQDNVDVIRLVANYNF